MPDEPDDINNYLNIYSSNVINEANLVGELNSDNDSQSPPNSDTTFNPYWEIELAISGVVYCTLLINGNTIEFVV